MKRIDSLNQWLELSRELTASGFRLWQMQYHASTPEGFRAWFWCSGEPDIEVVTSSKEVQDAILKYK